jgi:Stress responsive A/B Barrel Domain
VSMLVHNVFFKLKESDETHRAALVVACRKYLKDHPGIIFFAVGTPDPELTREVNDRDFDVSLHIVFQSRADHDAYQEAPLHLQFVAENKPGWAKVRVFDSIAD